MSSAKSRNFRRRGGGEDEDGEENNAPAATPAVKSKGIAASAASKSSSVSKQQKSSSGSDRKNLLSFSGDIEESLFTPAPSKQPPSSSLRSSKSSSHQLTYAKDRSAPHPPSSSVPSNVQPQPGTYTKEALLELQKNTRTLAASARSKQKPEEETVVLLKGLIKPATPSDLDSTSGVKSGDLMEHDADFGMRVQSLSVEKDITLTKLNDLGIKGLDEDKERIPDKATIEAAKAERERLRKAKAAAPDYIALDGGSNHGAAEGLSDEEPEYRGRIGFFAEKIISHDGRGVFENVEQRVISKDRDRGIENGSDSEDEEDKMWEEEQVRKGLGKRLDNGAGVQGIGVSISTGVNSTPHVVGPKRGSGYFGDASAGMYTPEQYKSSNNADSGNVVAGSGGLYGSDVIPISQQAELAKKALNASVVRLKESHDRTLMSLANADENLSSSLLRVTTLENSLASAGEKFVFMQKLRDFTSVICEFLQHKAPYIEELEEHMQKVHEERAKAIAERRQADNDDEMPIIQAAIMAARGELVKGGNNAAKVAAAASAAAQAASDSAGASSTRVELDEFGRDVNLQKRMNIIRRSEARQKRRAKADDKRKLAIQKDSSCMEMDGELSTDESDTETKAHESTRNELLNVADKIFSDAAEEYSNFDIVVENFDRWKKQYATSYRDAYMPSSIPTIFSPYVRLELLKWDALHQESDFVNMRWHSLLFSYSQKEDDDDANLIPYLVEKLAIPILRHQLNHCWDILSTHETKCAVSAMKLIIRYVDFSSSDLGDLISILCERLTKAVADMMVPTWSQVEMNAVPNAARLAAYRYGSSIRLMRNICLWNNILAIPFLEKIALDQLLSGKILPHLRSIQSNVHDAIFRTERLVASMSGVWAGAGVTKNQGQKLERLVDYLLSTGKTLEGRRFSGEIDVETGKLVRRLKKILVELNEYDHARAILRTFKLKEAL